MDMEYEFSCSTSYTSSQETPSPSLHTHQQLSHQSGKAGRKKFKETRHPIYRGVKQRKGTKWVCEVECQIASLEFGLELIQQPRAYDVAALALRGKSAPLNFRDSTWLLPRAKSTSAIDIRATAYEAAEEFQLTDSLSNSSSSSTIMFSTTVDKELLESYLKSIEETSFSMIFWDEEAMLNMPSFLDSMAEGLLLSPPGMLNGCN